MPVFVDTGAWFACLVKQDPDYSAARKWMKTNRRPLVTSDYVIDETLTLLLTRAGILSAVQMGKMFFTQGIARIEYVTPDDILNAWNIFEQYKDKSWSFTDCTSKVLIERLKIQEAFSFDKHFDQFSSITRVP